MTDTPEWYDAGTAHVWRPYCQMKTARPPLAVARTEGARLILADGRTLIDGVASWWTACHGYNHPHIAAAVRAQLDRAPHMMFGGLAHEPAYRLARRLAGLLPGDLDHVFFAESGSVAVEIAMKMAIQYWINRGEKGRTRFVSFLGGYHGDTLATMNVCDPEEGMHAIFNGVMPPQHVVPLPADEGATAALDRLLSEKRGEIAAILVEPLVQGAGGMVMHAPEVLRRLRELADRHGVLLVFDEIFTGFGRTGTLFAMEQLGVAPDILVSAKSIAAGLPLAATTGRAEIMDKAHVGGIGGTYGGNPLACVAAIEVLKLFEQGGLLARAEAIGQAVRERAAAWQRDIALIGDVRGMGAMIAIELVKDRATRAPAADEVLAVVKHCAEHGLLTMRAGLYANCLRLLMPLVIGNDQLQEGLDVLEDGLRAVSA